MSGAPTGAASEGALLLRIRHGLTTTGWVQPVGYAGQVNNVAIRVAAQTTGGKGMLVHVGALAHVSHEDLRQQGTAAGPDALRAAKLDQAVLSLMDFVQEMTSKRQGYAGHRGYFKVVAVTVMA